MFGLLSENTGIHETEYHYGVKMREYISNILQKIDIEIDEIDLYGYDIIETSLSMVYNRKNEMSIFQKRNEQNFSFFASFFLLTFSGTTILSNV